ncbi:hypothetical protein M426DRAFT_141811 [Hypoxylon sp. CI-4A]|nr:hypothetical protein M426DRAFT_141811 [Hypoxylon sp. CI-4A]
MYVCTMLISMPRETEGLPRDRLALHEFCLLCILKPFNVVIASVRFVCQNCRRQMPRISQQGIRTQSGADVCFSPRVRGIAAYYQIKQWLNRS